MPKLGMYEFNPIKLIEEVKKRPGLYRTDQPLDREEKLMLWKEVGASLYNDWACFSKATAYDRVLQLQRKWRSLRDAYNRELRARRSGVRINRRVYMYFKRMSFLGGFDGSLSEEEDEVDGNNVNETHSMDDDDPLVEEDIEVKPKKKRKVKKKQPKVENVQNDEMEMQMFPIAEISSDETDSDRLFLLSFLPEMRQLPLNVKMWARAQIANIMQEAVASHFSNNGLGHDKGLPTTTVEMKIQRQDSSECPE
ncbi:uncharacterized protein [Epargyreus clarus]|uniref:uncharacterized protein n=1 Tax=Epargyreus clarus TaxID=520877 RepID=UPI003C2C2237